MNQAAIHREIERLYKGHFGKLVGSLLHSFSSMDPETAEDIVHDSFSTALTHWTENGIPLNTTGWVYKVCKHKALNRLRKDKVALEHGKTINDEPTEIKLSESTIEDYQLGLLFACAHPDLSPRVAVIITLKYVVNLRVEAIANTFGVTVDAIDKLLVRARQQIKDERILFKEPEKSSIAARLPIVHKTIYLIFNEGYKSASGKELVREDLCEEALLLNKGILDARLGNRDTEALYALMLLNSARIRSRFSATNEILDLESQDRSLWNRDLILLGTEYLLKARSDVVYEYHIEASIAYYHCIAPSYQLTDWTAIAGLYVQLQNVKPNPFVDLNYAIALYNCGKKSEAFSKLHHLERNAFFNRYYLLNTALGKLYQLEEDYSSARQYYAKALGQTNFQQEKSFISKKMEEVSIAGAKVIGNR